MPSERFKQIASLGMVPEDVTDPLDHIGALGTYVKSEMARERNELLAPIMGPILSDMMGTEGLPEDPSAMNLAKEQTWKGVGLSILHEGFKSYGIRYDFEGDEGWSFNAENVKKSWEESKFWTILDWGLLLAGPLKLGSAALKVGKAASVGGRVLKSAREGSVAAQTVLKGADPRGIVGRGIGMFSDDYARATMVEAKAGTSALKRSRFGNWATGFLRSPMADSQLKQLEPVMKELAIHDPGNTRSLANMYLNGAKAERAYGDHLAGKAMAGLTGMRAKLGAEGMKAAAPAWNEGLELGREAAVKSVAHLGDEASEAIGRTWDLRNQFAERMVNHDLMDAGQLELFGKGSGGAAKILDPMQSTQKFWDDIQELTKRETIRGLGNSAVAGDAKIILAGMSQWSDDILRANGLQPEVREMAKAALGDHTGVLGEELLAGAGWKRMGELGFDAGKEGAKWVDPHAAPEIAEMFKFYEAGRFEGLQKTYHKAMRTFRATKTAYNPGTWAVNYVGNIPFYNFATGKLKMVPNKGISLLRHDRKGKLSGADGDRLQRMFQTGVLDSNEMAGMNKLLAAKVGEKPTKSAMTPILEHLGVKDKKLGKYVDSLAQKGEAGYRHLDDIWKADAFIVNEDAALKAMGVTVATASKSQLDEAAAAASERIIKGMPMFNRMSPFAELSGQAIPFSNFTAEAIRIWKNQVLEKPHLAYAWAHAFTTMSLASTIPAGISPDGYAAMKDGLPGHARTKPHLLLPMKVDGEARVLDLSWMMPLGANFSQAGQEMDEGLLGPLTSFFDFSANPLVGLGMAASSGKNPFTGGDLQAPTIQQTVGRVIPGVGTGRAAGLVEYAMSAAVPPWAPTGYVARNLMESALGLKGAEGQPLEGGIAETVVGNFARLKTYGYTELNAIRNAKARQRQRDGDIEKMWGHLDNAVVNRNPGEARWAETRLKKLGEANGEDGDAFFYKGWAGRNKIGFKGSKKVLREVAIGGRRVPDRGGSADVQFYRQEFEKSLQQAWQAVTK